MQQIEDIRL
jgi:hypothetical protein